MKYLLWIIDTFILNLELSVETALYVNRPASGITMKNNISSIGNPSNLKEYVCLSEKFQRSVWENNISQIIKIIKGSDIALIASLYLRYIPSLPKNSNGRVITTAISSNIK